VDYPPFSEEKEGKEEDLPPFSTLPDPSIARIFCARHLLLLTVTPTICAYERQVEYYIWIDFLNRQSVNL
jgi:hypothetical protein